MNQVFTADTSLEEHAYKDVAIGNFLSDSEDQPIIFVYQDAETRLSDSKSAQLVIFPSSGTLLNFVMASGNIIQKGNSTKQTKPSEEVKTQLLDIFSEAKDEIFESGMETEFSKNLLAIITKYDSAAMDAITDLILSGSVNPEVAAETMRWLGLMASPLSYRQRRWLLARSLRDTSERVRDAASLGLSYIDDPWAIPYLENAIKDEQIPELRSDMEHVWNQLKSTLENS